MSKSLKPLSYAIVSFLILAAYWRIYIGVDFTDEAQYVSESYTLLIGGKAFVTETWLQQTVSILFTPLTWLYVKAAGSTDGIMLFIRHLFFLLTVITGSVVFLALRKHIETHWAFLASASGFVYQHNSLPSLCYNTVVAFALCTGLFMALDAHFQKNKILAVLSGMLLALAAYSYVSFIVPTMFFYGIFFHFSRESKKVFQYSLLGFGIGLAASAAILLACGLDNLKNAVVMTSQGSLLGVKEKYDLIAHQAWGYFSLPVFASAAVIIAFGKRYLGSARFHVGFLVALILYRIEYSIYSESAFMHYVIIWSTFFFLPAFYFLCPQLREKKEIFYLGAVPSIVAGLVVMVSSGSGLSTAPAGLLAGFIVLAYYFCKVAEGRVQSLAFVCAAAMPVVLVSQVWGSAFRDLKPELLDTRMPSGPYAGLYTTEAKVGFMLQVQQDVVEASRGHKSIFFFDHFPAGYLFTDLKPMTFQLMIQPSEFAPQWRTVMVDFFSKTENLPDVVVEFFALPIQAIWHLNPKEGNPFNDPFKDFFMKTGSYRQVVSRDLYQILVKKDL